MIIVSVKQDRYPFMGNVYTVKLCKICNFSNFFQFDQNSGGAVQLSPAWGCKLSCVFVCIRMVPLPV